MKSVVAFIPIRSGSKSIPRKNMKMIAGKPLTQWIIDASKESKHIGEVYVASDNPNFSQSLKDCVHIGRSAITATDTAPSESALLEFVFSRQPDEIIVFLQATSPLISAQEIDKGIEMVLNKEYDSVLSVVEQRRFIWTNIDGKAESNYDIAARPRRQEFDGHLVENGGFYISKAKDILNSRCRISGKIGTVKCSDETYFEIDEPSDWIIAENLLLNRREKMIDISKIKLLVCDVDGTLTDGTCYYSEDGQITKKFNVKDGLGLRLLREQTDIEPIFLTSSSESCILWRAKALEIECHHGVQDKLMHLECICKARGLTFDNVAYIGDDINDYDVISRVALSFAPNDAHPSIKKIVKYVLSNRGGKGCVREVIEQHFLPVNEI
jgi:YrbI family 3-deoxy-D-manno-octulosonate 8-phosphate phosphatase